MNNKGTEDLQVEQILKVTDKKKKILLEDGTSFVLYSGEVRKFHLRENEIVSGQTLEEIFTSVLTKRAKLRCMNLLKASDRTVWQLQDRLKRDGYPEWIIKTALDYVASYHYTDDLRYAENFIRLQMGKKSSRMIRLELQKKGISSEDITRAFEDVKQETKSYGSQTETGDMAAIRKLVQKRHFDSVAATWEEKQKLIAYLARKGFSMSDIRAAIGSFPEESV